MAITSISNSYGGSALDSMGSLSSGKRINSAADDAAGLSVSEKMKTQATAYDAGSANASQGMDTLRVADGALSGVQDYLQRIKELAVKASNGTASESDMKIYQKEIGALKKGILEIAKNTEFNSLKLLDGSMADLTLATNPDGTGMKIQMADATLENLGIQDFDVTGNFDMKLIDKAMDKISSARGKMGADLNSLQNLLNYNSEASYNTTSAVSRLEDLDFPKAVSEVKKNETLNEYKTMMQRKKMEDDRNILGLFQ